MMKYNIHTCLIIAGITLLSGCVNQDSFSHPNTQTGVSIGTVAGAVIGGNVGDRSGSNIAGGAVLGTIVGGAIGEATNDSHSQQTGGWE